MIHYNTINEQLRSALNLLMSEEVFRPFRLVGGTALSLQIGHRESIDIDLFTDAPYGSVDFDAIDACLNRLFSLVDHSRGLIPGMGKSYFISENPNDPSSTVKLDVFYSNDPFMQPVVEDDQIRMASIEEIIAMKIDVVQRGGRKKDFWDIHALLGQYNIPEMIELHQQRYEWTHERTTILNNFLED